MATTDISPLQYMRAHGQSPGPTQRPLLTGALSGLVAFAPALALRYYSGALESEATAVGCGIVTAVVATILVAIAAGVLYALVFQRAANDMKGGWLFGSSFGFLIWLIGPGELWQLATGRPLATGTAAMGHFASYVLYGLILGAVFPVINKLLQKRTKAL